MKKRISKILAVLLAVCMMPIPFASLPVSAATAVDYDDADDGDLLYTVDFTGDSVFSSPDGGWSGATISSQTESSFTMGAKGSSRKGSVWGADLKGYTVLGKSYTVEFTLSASNNTQEIGFFPDDWAGFVIKPGQNEYKFVTTMNNGSGTEGKYEKEITSGTYSGTGELTQTYAIEFKISGTEDAPSIDAYNLYVKSGNAWILACSLADDQLDESNFDWFYYDGGVYEEDFTMRFYRRYYKLNSSGATTSTKDSTQQGTVTVSDAKVYKGLVASKSHPEGPVDGDLLYKVNFNGNSNMSALSTQKWGNRDLTITRSTNGDSVSIKTNSSSWGDVISQLNGLNIQNGSYTFIFTVTASDNNEEVGLLLDHQTGFVVNPGQNKVRYTDHLNWADNGLDTVDVIEPITYKGTGSLMQTYAVEVAGEGEGKNSKGQPYVDITAYNLYNLTYDGEGNAVWNLACSLTEDQLSSFFFDWGAAGDCDSNIYARFSRDRMNYSSANNGTITVSNFLVYEGLAIPEEEEEAVDIEPIYNVNFNGNDGVFSNIKVMYDGMGVRTVTDEGRTIELAATTIPSVKGSVLSGQMYGNDAMLGNSYTVVFTVDAPDNQSVGIFFKYRDGFFLNPMNNTYSVGYCGNDGADVEKYVATTEYNGSGAAKQTYAVEFASGNVAGSDGKYNCSAYKLWVQQNGKWTCIAELSADVREEIAWNENDYEFMIQLARVSDGDTNTGSVKVSNMDVYSGLVASKLNQSQKIYYQLTKDNSNLRIIGAVDFTEEELKNYANLGFNVTMTFGGRDYTNTFTTTTVYTSLVADGKTIYASEYGNYFFAVEITDLEFAAAEDVVFQVEGFATKLDQSVENVLGSKKIKIDGDPLSILPTFTGYSFEDTDTGDDCYMRSFGAVDYSDFDDYCDDIAEKGFELYAENTLEDNVYRTYVNKRYVVTTIYTGYNSYGKVLVEPRVGTDLPTKAEDNIYTPIAGMDTTITQVGMHHEDDIDNTYNGMAYIIQLNDGSFIVVDGGVDTTLEKYEDRIYNVLKKQAPDPDNIVIAAWIITHAHDDHVDVFEGFFKSYADKVTVEKFICNLPVEEQLASDYWGSEWNRSAIVREQFEEYFPNVPVIKAHPGQEFYVRNAKIDILYTIDIYDYDNSALRDFNNTSVVFKLTAEGKSMLFLGDYDDNAYTMKQLYTASTLNSDIVQMAHHGLASYSSGALYQWITPEYVFWPVAAWVVQGEDVYNGTQNKWIIQNCNEKNIYLAEDNVHVFNMKTCECVKYDTVAKYVASK